MQPWKVLKPWRRGWPDGPMDGEEWCVHWWSWFMNSKVDQKSFRRCFFVHWESSSKIPDPVLFQKSAGFKFKGIRCVNPPLPTHHCSPGWLKKNWRLGQSAAGVRFLHRKWLLSESDLKRSPTFHPTMFYWQCLQALWAIVNWIRQLIV